MIAAFVVAAAALAAEPAARVCPDPAHPCPGFRAHDLSFRLPRDGVARPEVRSAPFWAVILASGARCAFGEAQRLEAQAQFAASKVFVQRFECGAGHEDNVTYTNVDAAVGFLAVYAGSDRAAGEAMLARVKAGGRFPGANLRRMQVTFVFP